MHEHTSHFPSGVRFPVKPLTVLAILLLVASLGADAEVLSFTLIDATNDQPITVYEPILEGATLQVDQLPNQLNIRADVTGSVDSVEFELRGAETIDQTESFAPYALFGDSSGDYNPWTPAVGEYVLTARSFSGGLQSVDLVLQFSVDNSVAPPPDGDGSVAIFAGDVAGPEPLKRWHRLTLALSGLGTTETSTPNPFLDYRFQVLFTGPSGQMFDVPGYFAGDGLGGSSGTAWHVHLSPNEVGTWNYEISLREGSEVAVDTMGLAGTSVAPFDGLVGSFEVIESDATGADFRAPGRGLIKHRGGHYLSEADGDPWVKGGPDIPENLLGYEGFDNTPNAGHSFSAHVSDWRPGDPDWNSGDGRGIIGALNYIADRGANVVYFLPMNLFGDGRDSFPTISESSKTRYDLSKLEQWESVFTHAQSRGIFLHFVLAETESGNENYHDGGTLGPERKLFYRMLIARFGHHNGLEWNLGEENDYGTAKHRDFAAYLKAVDPYDHPVTTHTKSNQYENFYAPLLGNGDFDLTSFQGNNSRASMFDLIEDWRSRSADSGQPWAISFDEPQKIENDVTDNSSGYPHGRRDKMWPVYMAGGAGFEWYVQQDGGGHSFDQQIDDFSLMGEALTWTGHALSLLSSLPLHEMTPNRLLASSGSSGEVYTLSKENEVYLIYHDRSGGPLILDLSAASSDQTFNVRWFDPRLGGALQIGDVSEVSGGSSTTDLGSSPHTPSDDWVCLVRFQDSVLFADGFEMGNTSAWSAAVP